MSMLDLMKMRRSRYSLTDRLAVPAAEVEKLVAECLKQAPSAFNSQSARVVLVLADGHKKLWHIVLESLRPLVPADKFGETEKKIKSFAAAFGTILFLEDEAVVRSLQEKFPTYKEHFPAWSQQSGGMLQFAVWTALAEKGIGASLQHYNPLIDEEVARVFHLPKSWKLLAQMPFGEPFAEPEEKTFLPLSQRLRVEW